MLTNNKQSNKGGLALYIKINILMMVNQDQIFTRNGIETICWSKHTSLSGIITVGLVYKWCVDSSTENFSAALEEIISFLKIQILKYVLFVTLT